MTRSARLEAVPFHGAAIAEDDNRGTAVTERRGSAVLLAHDVTGRHDM
jgi:hypothetical protein